MPRLVFLIAFAAIQTVASADGPDFETVVGPLLTRRCLECHQSVNPSGGFAVDSADGIHQGGDSGPVLVSGDVAGSLMFQRVRDGEMPPARNGHSRKLPDAEIQILQEWMEAGAPFPGDVRLDLFDQTTETRGGRDWWAFQPLSSAEPPLTHGGQNPIDAWIQQSLRDRSIQPAPQASPDVLLRRLSWDLTGLPPQSVIPDAKAPQSKPDYDALVDRLLTSPHFGERWARHWLDVVRYADSCGYERDQHKPNAWKYRDWVVHAFNTDMPYDRFVREQLAGDELDDRSESSLIATGFLRVGTWNDEPNDPEDYKYERLEDLVNVTCSAFLGLTVKCARCHDHKFDPIPQADYYRVAAAFWPGPIEPRARELLGGPTAEELGAADVLGWTDITRSPAPLHVLKNGERHHPLQSVPPGPLSCLPTGPEQFVSAEANVRTTHLRRQLADWITSPGNPLTARVIVNRIWLAHFGEGLVRTANNFGFTGDQPTHPELLDWLAAELIRNRWSLRHLHRLILTSETWKQASLHPDEQKLRGIDFANRFWWRANRRRMDAESIRDALLACTGELDLRMGGPGFFATVSADALEGLSRKGAAWTASPDTEQRRRSLYLFSQRSLMTPMMTTFDMADTTLPCAQRDVTIVAPQALTLMNNEFVHLRAEVLAQRVMLEEANEQDRVRRIWQATLGRLPDQAELMAAVRHVNEQRRQFEAIPAETLNANPELQVENDVPSLISMIQGENNVRLEESCRLFLDASKGLEITDTGSVMHWGDLSRGGHHAEQTDDTRRPQFRKSVDGKPAAVSFNGSGQFLHLNGQVLQHDDCTVFAVVTDRGPAGHRELISNWSGRDGNSGTSFFVGMTGTDSIRFSDAISGVGRIEQRESPFLLTATNGANGAAVFQQARSVVNASRLPDRRLETPWVLGQQGNIEGEYWNGDVLLLIVLDRQLNEAERTAVWNVIGERFSIPVPTAEPKTQRSADLLAWSSLALVLMNSNEFLFVD